MTGRPALPDPSKGVLDQEYEIMVAFQLLGDAAQEWETIKQERAKQQEAIKAQLPQNIIGGD